MRVVSKAVSDPPAAPASSSASTKRVYTFGNGTADGDAGMKTLLGGKGANLAEMSSIGLSVPAGFTVTTDTCAAFHENDGQLPEGCWEEMMEGLAKVEECMGKKLGDPSNPLLLSVGIMVVTPPRCMFPNYSYTQHLTFLTGFKKKMF